MVEYIYNWLIWIQNAVRIYIIVIIMIERPPPAWSWIYRSFENKQSNAPLYLFNCTLHVGFCAIWWFVDVGVQEQRDKMGPLSSPSISSSIVSAGLFSCINCKDHPPIHPPSQGVMSPRTTYVSSFSFSFITNLSYTSIPFTQLTFLSLNFHLCFCECK